MIPSYAPSHNFAEVIRALYVILRDRERVKGSFEAALSNFLFHKNYIILSSGRRALYLGLKSLGIKKGEEIIIPAFTTDIVPLVIRDYGSKPIPADCNIEDYNISVDSVLNCISNRTGAILTVHTFGCPSQLDALRDICDDYNLFLIEDAAAAFGAEFDGRYVGTYGDIGIVSFGIGKSLSLGDGGMLIINNDEIKESLESGYYPQEFKSPLEAFMAISGSIVLAHQGLYGIIGKRIKDRRISGQYANYRKEMSDERDISLFSYAIGLQELLSDAISKRRATAMYYNNYIGQLEDVYPPIEKERTRSVYTRYFVRANSKCKKRDLINRMLKSGVEPLVPDNGFPISQNLYSKFFIDKIPQSHLLSHTLFGVPNHMRLPKYLLANIFE